MEQTNRTRSRVYDTVTEQCSLVVHWFKDGSCTKTPVEWATTDKTSQILTTHVITEVMTDVVTEGFEGLSNKGLIINSPMEKTKVERCIPPFELDLDYLVQQWGCTPGRWYDLARVSGGGTRNVEDSTWSKGLFCDSPSLASEIEAAASLAVTGAWASISSSEMLSLVSVFEAEKTLAGFIDTGKRITKFIRHLKKLQLTELKRNFRSLRKAKKAWNGIKEEFSFAALANRYMEARYGWRPLYYDAVAATNAFRAQFKNVRQTFRGHESFTAGKVTDFSTSQLWVDPSIFYLANTLTQTSSVEVDARAGVLCDVDLAKFDPWGLTDWSSTIYELVPYSFVADWFFNIGDTIAMWVPDYGFTAKSSWVVKRVTTTKTSTLSSVPVNLLSSSTKRNFPACFAKQNMMWEVTEHVTRVPNPSRDVLPTLKLRLNAAKLIDLAIVAKNLMHGGNFPLSSKRSLRI